MFPVITYGDTAKILLRLGHEFLTGPDGMQSEHFVLVRAYRAPEPLYRGTSTTPRRRRDTLTTPPPTETPSAADHRSAPADARP
eukprot:1779770-Prorocentrum_lima.AAC.1